MKFRHAGAACAVLLVLVGASTSDAQSQTHPPAEAFGQLPQMSRPSLSPDGKHFAVVQPFEGRPVAVIYQINAPAGTKPAVVQSADSIIQNVAWAKNDRLLIYVGVNKKVEWDERHQLRSWGRTISVSDTGDNSVILMKNDPSFKMNTTTARVVDVDLDDPDQVFMPMWEYDTEAASGNKVDKLESQYFHMNLYSVNVRTGRADKFMTGTSETGLWLLDGHGHVVARVDEMTRPLKDHLFVRWNDDWRDDGQYDASADKGVDLIGVLGDGTAIVRYDHVGSDRSMLLRHDLATGKEVPLWTNPTFDAGEAITDEWTGRITGISYAADKDEYEYFDPKREALQRGLEQAFPGKSVRAASVDLDQNEVIAEVQSPREPPSYYYLDRTSHQATKIATQYPGLTEADLGEMKPYPYRARDGLSIPAYVTLPPGRVARNLPTVVMPHGGPDARDTISFDWWAQFMANRGYVVLQPNFRGSWGYGHKYTEAGLRQWGLKMQDDISDGVHKLIADGIADPKRVCIVGGSYGGYAALAGATLTPDLYACAVSFAGISDLRQMLDDERTKHGTFSGVMSFWQSRIGDLSDDDPQLSATSPVLHADQVKCPILLMHGEDDTTVPIKQSELMNDALVQAHKDVEFVRFPGEDHYLEMADTRIKMLKELEKFLDAHIGH
jgi:dipeptidyl aminopeptidase/acylaminoacyl peptidase